MSRISKLLRGFVRLVDAMSMAGAAAAALALAIITAIMGVEILVRAVFGFSIEFSWEFSAYLMAAMFFLGSAYTLRTGSHIRMGAAVEQFSPRITAVLDVAATLIGLAVMLLVAYAMTDLAWQAHLRGSVSFTTMETYMAIPQMFPAVGAALVVLQLLARLACRATGQPVELPVADEELLTDR